MRHAFSDQLGLVWFPIFFWTFDYLCHLFGSDREDSTAGVVLLHMSRHSNQREWAILISVSPGCHTSHQVQGGELQHLSLSATSTTLSLPCCICFSFVSSSLHSACGAQGGGLWGWQCREYLRWGLLPLPLLPEIIMLSEQLWMTMLSSCLMGLQGFIPAFHFPFSRDSPC